MKRIIIFSLLILINYSSAKSQSAKKYFSSAEKYLKAQSYSEAITNYNKCLELDPNFSKAFSSRAFCYEKLDKKEEAAQDYKHATVFKAKDKELYYNAARLFFDIGNFKEADEMSFKAVDLDKKYLEAIELRVNTLLILKKFDDALIIAELGVEEKKSAINFFNRAVVLDSLKRYSEAEKGYKESKYYDSKFIPAYVGLALVEIKLNKSDEALKVCELALSKVPNSIDIFYARSQIHAIQSDFQSALNDISKVVVAKPNDLNASFMRAVYYQKLGQWQNAINDYNNCIKINNNHIDSYLARASAFEHINDFSSAINDYNKILSLGTSDETKLLLIKAKDKLFELKRESNKPNILLTNPIVQPNNSVNIPGDLSEILVRGQVTDANKIKSVLINGMNVKFEQDSLNPLFSSNISLVNKKDIAVQATDVYENIQTSVFPIIRTEIDKPIIAFTTPYTSFDREIVLNTTDPELYVEGKVKDASEIESIVIDGVSASFAANTLNPIFSAKISVANKNKITAVVKDKYGNVAEVDFTINRDGALAVKDNPMGNTWMVFIENSSYTNFPTLEGPAKDVVMMKSALANYKISKIVHKKDMNKTELEKFFAIELRDLTKNNKINSLLVWYAGHGKFVNQTGYWIPVDAKADDEFTYFNINNLKAYMQSYTNLVHTLVITDACESGPSFYLALRDTPKEKRCENWEETKFKSAQVLSSAGYELAADLSQFTKTFAAALTNNPDACISIDKIAGKVTNAVQSSGKQAPKFGRISGLEDENGTFFFMKK